MKEFIYSRNAVYETLRAGRRQVFRLEIAQGVQEKGRILDILQMARERKIPVLSAPRAGLDKIHPAHQGVILESSSYPYRNLSDMLDLAAQRGEPAFLLILDTLKDPQNFGTLLRTAEAVGVHGVILPLARTVGVTPAVVNASSGAAEHLVIAQTNLAQTMDELKEKNIWLVGMDEEGELLEGRGKEGMRASPFSGAVGIVIGSEGEGIRPLVRSKCDFLVRLPMQGQVESLNAAVAGSVALYLAYLERKNNSF